MNSTLEAALVLGRPVDGDGTSWSRQLSAADPAKAIGALRGGFALAVPLKDGTTVLGVDRFARETICYAESDQGVRFSARADELAGPSPELDPQAIYDYLFFHAIPSPRTIFKGVHRLPPATLALARGGKVDTRRYWTPHFAPSAGGANFDVLAKEFMGLLETAVRDQLDAGVPGCFLSGGTDSSTVAGMIARTAGKVSTFSIGFEAEGYDEMQYARIAAKHFGADHHAYYVTPDDLVRSIAQVAASFDQPFGNSSVVPAYFCAKMAREAGVTRLLAGDGGDELFGGNSRYAKQKIFDAYARLPGPLRTGLLEPVFGGRDDSGIALLRKAASYIGQARLPMPERTHLYNLLLRLGVDEVLEPGFQALIDRTAPGRQQRAVWDEVPADSQIDCTLAYDWRYTLAESDLPKVRAATALAQVEVGYPMLDERLVDFSMRLPPSWKVKGLQLRWFFKQALRGFLPEEIITKKKQGFGLPFGVWATRHAALMELARDSMSTLAERGIVRPAFVQTLVERKIHEHPGYYGEMVWILMMLEQWLRAHAPAARWR